MKGLIWILGTACLFLNPKGIALAQEEPNRLDYTIVLTDEHIELLRQGQPLASLIKEEFRGKVTHVRLEYSPSPKQDSNTIQSWQRPESTETSIRMRQDTNPPARATSNTSTGIPSTNTANQDTGSLLQPRRDVPGTGGTPGFRPNINATQTRENEPGFQPWNREEPRNTLPQTPVNSTNPDVNSRTFWPTQLPNQEPSNSGGAFARPPASSQPIQSTNYNEQPRQTQPLYGSNQAPQSNQTLVDNSQYMRPFSRTEPTTLSPPPLNNQAFQVAPTQAANPYAQNQANQWNPNATATAPVQRQVSPPQSSFASAPSFTPTYQTPINAPHPNQIAYGQPATNLANPPVYQTGVQQPIPNYHYPTAPRGIAPSSSYGLQPNEQPTHLAQNNLQDVPTLNVSAPVETSDGSEPMALAPGDKYFSFLWFMLLCSIGLNFYLGWISRGFYLRYRDLADELRETFASPV